MARRVYAGLLVLPLGIGLGADRAAACDGLEQTGAYFVAPSGDDGDLGSWDHPFRTIERARGAMIQGLVRSTYIESGIYDVDQTFVLGPVDSGMSYLSCPGQSPVFAAATPDIGSLVQITGAQGVTIRGLAFVDALGPAIVLSSASSAVRLEYNRFQRNGTAIVIDGSNGNTICGNWILDSASTGIEVKDSSDANVLADNVVDGTGSPGTHGGAFYVHGARGTSILGNLVQNTRGAGIAVVNWDSTTINTETVIADNVVRDTNRASNDSGAIYLLGRSHVDTGTLISHNVVDGTGADGDAHTIGIYLDDSASGILVDHNILRNIGTHAVEIHGGDDIAVLDNFVDLGAGTATALLFQTAPADTNPTNTMRNNRVERNVFIAAGRARDPYVFIDGGGVPKISGNTYYNAAGWPSSVPDDNPLFRASDPIGLAQRSNREKALQLGPSIGPDRVGPSRRGASCGSR